MRPNLVAVPNSGLHDLPPRWDGHAVVWRGWEHITGFICGTRQGECCSSCGSVEWPTVNLGLVGDDPAMTHDDVQHDDVATYLARDMRVRRRRRTWYRLVAFRCVDCGHDTVLDDNDNWWDLDVSDYGDSGSVPPASGVER